jgi:hypothetical protein
MPLRRNTIEENKVLQISQAGLTSHWSGWTGHTVCFAYFTSHRSVPGR